MRRRKEDRPWAEDPNLKLGKPSGRTGEERERDISIRAMLYLDLKRSTFEKLYTFSI